MLLCRLCNNNRHFYDTSSLQKHLINIHQKNDCLEVGYPKKMYDRAEARGKVYADDIVYKLEGDMNQILECKIEDTVMVEDDAEDNTITIMFEEKWKSSMPIKTNS